MKTVKVIVKEDFRDKYSGVIHKKDKPLEISDERYREIKRAGNFVEAIKETTKTEKAEAKDLKK